MRKIDIDIRKAEIVNFTVTLGKEYPEIMATIALFTETGRQIASYSISTNAWNEEAKFELPVGMVGPIRKIMDDLERIAIENCSGLQKKLAA